MATIPDCSQIEAVPKFQMSVITNELVMYTSYEHHW
jgi:hypothetical protein